MNPSFRVSSRSDSIEINYLSQLSDQSAFHYFCSPWGGIVLRDCNEVGDIMEFNSVAHYNESKKKSHISRMWVYLRLKIFSHAQNDPYGVFICPHCPSMSGVGGLVREQLPESIESVLCMHSRVANTLVKDWRLKWDASADFGSFTMKSANRNNEDVDVVRFVPRDSSAPFLAGVSYKNKISFLYCVTRRQETPFCTICVQKKCEHFKIFQQWNDRNDGDLIHDNDLAYNPIPDEEEEELGYADHYLIHPPDHTRGKLYGFNFQPILYPISRSPSQQIMMVERMSGIFNLPAQLIPKFDKSKVCKHGFNFTDSEHAIVLVSDKLSLFTEIGQRFFSSKVYSRPSSGPCKCLQRYDGHEIFIWNLGHGRFVDYSLLYSYLFKWRSSGLSISAMFRSLKDLADSCEVTVDLNYQDLHRSICGFMCNLSFDIEQAFSCPEHGTSPKWIVADGKAIGPLKKRVKHLQELDIAPTDSKILEQTTHHKDRVFLSLKKERNAVLNLVTGLISMDEFAELEDIDSDHGLLIKEIVAYVNSRYPLKIPEPYVRLLNNVSKNSSVRSLIQVNDLGVLDVLRKFCTKELDIRQIVNKGNFHTLATSLPALWPLLDNICTLEKSKFLPSQVSRLVLRMLKVREETFEKCVRRSESDVVKWPDSKLEHPTMAYPTFPIRRYPSKYKVNEHVDSDICEKAFTNHGDFCAGMFSVGCACPSNTTFGFEIMLSKESPKNLFRFLMTRSVNMSSLDGILVDFGCLFEPYVMNREAQIFKDKIVLVDGAHWAAQKKMRKSDKSGKGGHSG